MLARAGIVLDGLRKMERTGGAGSHVDHVVGPLNSIFSTTISFAISPRKCVPFSNISQYTLLRSGTLDSATPKPRPKEDERKSVVPTDHPYSSSPRVRSLSADSYTKGIKAQHPSSGIW